MAREGKPSVPREESLALLPLWPALICQLEHRLFHHGGRVLADLQWPAAVKATDKRNERTAYCAWCCQRYKLIQLCAVASRPYVVCLYPMNKW